MAAIRSSAFGSNTAVTFAISMSAALGTSRYRALHHRTPRKTLTVHAPRWLLTDAFSLSRSLKLPARKALHRETQTTAFRSSTPKNELRGGKKERKKELGKEKKKQQLPAQSKNRFVRPVLSPLFQHRCLLRRLPMRRGVGEDAGEQQTTERRRRREDDERGRCWSESVRGGGRRCFECALVGNEPAPVCPCWLWVRNLRAYGSSRERCRCCKGGGRARSCGGAIASRMRQPRRLAAV